MANTYVVSLFRRVSDVVMRYHQEAITPSGETLDFPVTANRVASPGVRSSTSMEQVFQLMRQSSAGVNLISHKSDQCVMEGYLYMRKGSLLFCTGLQNEHRV